MSTPVPLSSVRHADLRISRAADYGRYRNQHLIPIVTKDFFTLAAEFPLVFVKGQSQDEFVPVAVMGLKEGQNLYCRTERWPAQVVPVTFHNPPFSIVRVDEGGEKFMVLIDEESPLVSKTEGEPIFTERGEKTEYAQQRIDALVDNAQLTLQTQTVCRLLREKNLLITHRVQLQYRPESTRYNIEGIYVVDEQALNKLPDKDFLYFRKQGLLPLIYAHLTSLQQLRRISQLQYEADQAAAAAS